MQEKYSEGFHSEVYTVSKGQKLWFPSADLVRIDKSTDKNWFARLFYRHKIAQTLFPDNFINVVGSQVDPWQEELVKKVTIGGDDYTFQKERVHRLFSEIASVPSSHAIFSEHMSANGKSLHNCAQCIDHIDFHRSNDIVRKAIEVTLPMQKIGIYPPIDDPSDYCLTEKDKIIFFEIEDFDSESLGEFLRSLKLPTDAQKKALVLVKRFRSLQANSEHRFDEAAGQGVGNGAEIRLN